MTPFYTSTSRFNYKTFYANAFAIASRLHQIRIRIWICYSNALFTESETRFSVNPNPDSIIEYALT